MKSLLDQWHSVKHHDLTNETSVLRSPKGLQAQINISIDQWNISISVSEKVASPTENSSEGAGRTFGIARRGGKNWGGEKKRRRAVRGLLCLAWCIALSVGHRTEPTLIRYRPMNKNNLSRRTIPINKTKYLSRGFHTSDRWSVWSVWYIPT